MGIAFARAGTAFLRWSSLRSPCGEAANLPSQICGVGIQYLKFISTTTLVSGRGGVNPASVAPVPVGFTPPLAMHTIPAKRMVVIAPVPRNQEFVPAMKLVFVCFR